MLLFFFCLERKGGLSITIHFYGLGNVTSEVIRTPRYRCLLGLLVNYQISEEQQQRWMEWMNSLSIDDRCEDGCFLVSASCAM
jgi:hypothetical protein